jgi:hypothetical protein
MNIFQDTTESHTESYLEIDRFKAKILEIWSKMLEETYSQYFNEESEDSPSMEEFLEKNALKFSDEPEPESELDSLMDMLDSFMDDDEDRVEVESDAKAPTYKGEQLKSHNEKSKIKIGVYDVDNQTTKNPQDTRSRVQGGSYDGVENGSLGRKQDAKVIRKYAPLIQEIKEELRSLTERQRIGRRKMRFRL